VLRDDRRSTSCPGAPPSSSGGTGHRGGLFWLVYSGSLRAPTLIDFFDRLLASCNRKALAILDGMQWQRAASLVGWLQERNDQLLVFHTPDPQHQEIMPHAATDPHHAAERKTPHAPIDGKSGSFYSLQLKLLSAQSSEPKTHYTSSHVNVYPSGQRA
jgi:hypothetical protein